MVASVPKIRFHPRCQVEDLAMQFLRDKLCFVAKAALHLPSAEPGYPHRAMELPPAKMDYSPSSFDAWRKEVPGLPALRSRAAASSRRSSRSSSVAFNSRSTAFPRRICLSMSATTGLDLESAELIYKYPFAGPQHRSSLVGLRVQKAPDSCPLANGIRCWSPSAFSRCRPGLPPAGTACAR